MPGLRGRNLCGQDPRSLCFADENKRCYVYDKLNKKFFQNKINNILIEKNFYDFDDDIIKKFQEKEGTKLDKKTIELVFSKTVESYHRNILKNIENPNLRWFSIDSISYIEIYKCILIQLIRTPKGKEALVKLYHKVLDETDEKKDIFYLALEIIKVLQDSGVDSKLLLELLNSYGHICIGINNTDCHFITSDMPIIKIPFEHSEREVYYYPVTPKRCIFLLKRYVVPRLKLEDAANEECIKEHQRNEEIKSRLNPVKKDISQEFAFELNNQIYKNASRFIVSKESFTGKLVSI
ncbi:MAG: DUF4238 domain-containing protein [Acidaminococcaceae bacterium]|nr:DUF4238 domain-containing protein [Acidaminococcaceae bacterium]